MNLAKLIEAVKTAEPLAAELLKDPHHAKSLQVAVLRSRLAAAAESLNWHLKWLDQNPAPAAAPAAPAAPEKPTPPAKP